MLWVGGIDEAGYGPNLGPMVQAAVAVRVPAGTCPWIALAHVARRASGPADDRIIIDDSKLVHAGKRLDLLERAVFASTGLTPATLLRDARLGAEFWHDPDDAEFLGDHSDLGKDRREFAKSLCSAGMKVRVAGVVSTSAREINSAIDRHGTKAAATAAGVCRLLQCLATCVPRGDLSVVVDKQGGRHYYAALLSEAFPDAWPRVIRETPEQSEYQLEQAGRVIHVTFMPKADGRHMSVALASLIAKYLRERLMSQFNHFWQSRVPGLKPTAGYPVDARRFLNEIEPMRVRLGIAIDDLWRKR